jgi:hypothetical protein
MSAPYIAGFITCTTHALVKYTSATSDNVSLSACGIRTISAATLVATPVSDLTERLFVGASPEAIELQMRPLEGAPEFERGITIYTAGNPMPTY